MRIYVDFDDVLCETARELSRLARELYGCQVPYAAIRAFNLREAFGLDETRYLHLMRAAHETERLLALEPTPGAVATLARWAADGHTVEIVTGRPCATHAASARWLQRHGLADLDRQCPSVRSTEGQSGAGVTWAQTAKWPAAPATTADDQESPITRMSSGFIFPPPF